MGIYDNYIKTKDLTKVLTNGEIIYFIAEYFSDAEFFEVGKEYEVTYVESDAFKVKANDGVDITVFPDGFGAFVTESEYLKYGFDCNREITESEEFDLYSRAVEFLHKNGLDFSKYKVSKSLYSTIHSCVEIKNLETENKIRFGINYNHNIELEIGKLTLGTENFNIYVEDNNIQDIVEDTYDQVYPPQDVVILYFIKKDLNENLIALTKEVKNLIDNYNL